MTGTDASRGLTSKAVGDATNDTSEQGSEQNLRSSPHLNSDIGRLGLNARSSSPAKRTRDERDADDDTIQPPSTPPRKPNGVEIFSPMPNRSKAGLARQDSGTGTSVNEVSQSREPTATPPSYDEQSDRIRQLATDVTEEENQEGYLVASTWLDRVVSRTKQGLSEGHEKSLREGDVGPIDNRPLLPSEAESASVDLKDALGCPFYPIQEHLTRSEDFEILPREAWDLLVSWYGIAKGSPTIVRYMHNTSDNPNRSHFMYELRPPVFTIQRISTNRSRPRDSTQTPAPRIVANRSDRYQSFLKRAKEAAGVPMDNKVRLWKVIEAPALDHTANNLPTPDASPEAQATTASFERLHIEMKDLEDLAEGTQRELVDVEDNTANPNYNGKSTKVDTFGFSDYQTIILEEQLKTGTKGSWASDKNRQAAKPTSNNVVKVAPQPVTESKAKVNGAKEDRTPTSSGVLTRGRNKKVRGKGAIGLQNLGNTCYMNSALQCIRAVEELTWYFLSEHYKKDLNSDNPLGHNGVIAKSYASLIASFYEGSNSFSPRIFRTAVGRCQPIFSGYGQQDSQEFLSFLIDGLHEDLNRIHKKPYIENPDSDDARVTDQDYIKELGETYRENHRKRNSSVAQDLFTGFYKNTMECPECDKISVTFDPYAQVTLQLPAENAFRHPIKVTPLKGLPCIVDLEVDQNASIKQAKEYIAKKVPHLDPSKIVMFEEYAEKIYKLFDDRDTIAELSIQTADVIWAIEVTEKPTNIQKKKANNYYSYGSTYEKVPAMDSDAAEHMLVPVTHRSADGKAIKVPGLWPTFITVTREEAQKEDAIHRKILQRVQTMTTKNLLEGSRANVSTSDELTDDPDTVMTIGEDSSADDNAIQARSIEGEDDVVDVSMADAQEPSFLDPQMPLTSRLYSMFEIATYTGDREWIPTNKAVSGSRTELTSMEDRTDRVRAYDRQMQGRLDQRESPDELAQDSEESDEDEDDAIPPSFGRDSRKKAETIELGPDERYLIRMGEGILLEWQPDALDSLFGGDDKNDTMRGYPTEKLMETLPDAEAAAKRQLRANRKKHGVSLLECFSESAKTEVLSEDNAWYCNRCKELRRAKKTLELWTTPDVLIVHLKRFSSQSRMRDKVDVLVDFPIEGLDLTGRVGLPEGKSLVYDLFAVDRHFGGLGGGHYTANAKNFLDGKWYDYNDSFVTQVQPESAITSAAYLLFYRRRTETPLGPEYLQQIVEKAHGSSTRSSSESGEDQRDDPSSPSGSSKDLRGAAVGHQLTPTDGQQVGVTGGTRGPATQAKSADDELPQYDEAIAMEDDSHGGLSRLSPPSWGFDRTMVGSDDETLNNDNDNDSTFMERGSDVADDMMNISPVSSQNIEHAEIGQLVNEVDENNVHEIEVDDADDRMPR